MQGRHILWGWLQERRKVGTYNYAGCLGVPRMLRLQGERFIQVTLHGCWWSCLHAEAAGIRVDLLSILLA